MDAELATITAKGQVTIPKAILHALNLRQGDQLRWDLEDGGVCTAGEPFGSHLPPGC
jgi:AbrB family looped-hinge helix DNA binding protein